MKKTLLIFAVAAASLKSYGQQYLGVATGNWSGMMGMYLNPANITDNRERFVVDLIGFNAAVDNNLGTISSAGSIRRFVNGGNTSINDIFQFSSQNQFSLIAPAAEVRGPGLMLAINHKHSIAISSRLRAVNQLSNFNQSLYRTVTDFDYTTGTNIDFVSRNFNWTGHAWGEVSASYAAVIVENGQHELKVGGTIRYLHGIGYIGLKGNNLDLHYAANQDSIYALNTDILYSSNLVGSNSALSSGLGSNSIFNNLVNSKAGNGIGGDLGLVYDFIEEPGAHAYEMDGKTIYDRSMNRYKFRFSAAVTDLGSIRYNTNNNFTVNIKGNGYLTGKGLADNVKNYDDLRNYAARQGFTVDTGRSAQRLYMPTALNISLDYHVHRNFYFNIGYYGNLADRQNFGNSTYNRVAITPRFDTKRLSVAVPLIYNSLAGDMKAGLGIRVYGFYIGSDDLLVFASRQHGMNFYAGGFVAFAKHRVRDRDGDHVSDRYDLCPDEPGTWKTKGCPEKEEDDKATEDDEKKAKK